MMPYFVGLVFLSNFRGATLESAFVFAIMGVFALIASVMAYYNNIRPFKWWDGKFNKDDLKYIGMAYAGLLGIVYGVTSIVGGSIGILVALGGGAVVLFYSLKKSESLLVPWIAHFAYNTTSIALASFSIIALSASPLYVPNFTLDGHKPVDFMTQAFMQFAFVAFSEEATKIAVALGIFQFTKNKTLGFAISGIAWVALHTILSYPIKI